MESPKRKAKLRVGFGPVAGLLLIAAIAAAAVWGGSAVSAYVQSKRAAGLPHTVGEYYYYSPQERVDALFWEMVGWFEPVPLDPSKENPLLNVSGHCDESKLLEAEARYGDMPEYWQLRYAVENSKRHSTSDPMRLSPLSEEGFAGLRTATELAPDDPVSLWLYATVSREQGRMSVEQEIPYLRKCVELAPDEATFHGDYAEALVPLAVLDQAFAEYDAAGKASGQRYVQGFPTGYVQTLNLDYLRSRPDYIPHMASFLFSGVYRFLSGDFIEGKAALRTALATTNGLEDVTRLTILHRYACACALWEPNQNMNLLTGLSYQGIVRKRAEELGIGAERESKVALEHLDEIRHEAWVLPLGYGTSEWLYGGEKLRLPLLKPGGKLEYETGLVFGELSPAPWVEDARRILCEMAEFDYANPAAFVEEDAGDKTGDDGS